MYGPKGVERTYALHSQPRQQTGVELPLEGCRRRIPTHDERSTPLGPMVMGATFRGFATLTRGYRVVRPLRGRQLRGMRCTDIGTRTAVPPRHAAGMATGTAAPRGPHYSVTAGEHGEPADGEPHIYVRPQGGRTDIRSAQPATAAGRWRAATRGMPAQDTHIGRSTPLGPMVMGATFRGFATLTRGYRIVRPLRGRQLRGMCCTDIGTRTAVPQRHAAEMMAGTAAPRGPNYSITAGEHGEPAEGEPHIYMYGPKGVERTYALHSQPRQQAGGELPPEGCRRRTPT